jgi:hypothetical protein
MTKYDRSAQMWPLLVWSAHHQKILSYSIVEKLTGIPRMAVGEFLGPVYAYCEQQGYPPLTSLVVSKTTGEWVTEFEETAKLFAAHSRVFVFDWLAQDTPSSDDFKAAWDTHQSTSAVAP